MRICVFPVAFMLLGFIASPFANAERVTSVAQSIQKLPQDSRILAYVTGEEATETLLKVGREWDKDLGIVCEEEYGIKVHPAGIFVLATIDLPEDKKYPTDGVWQYRYELTRCGSRQLYNVIVAAGKNAPPQYGRLIPGRTLASPTLLRDTVGPVNMKVTLETKVKENKECKDFAVKDTNVTVMPQVSQTNGVMSVGRYEETWVVRYCGKDISIPICFSPKPDGGTSMLTQLCKEVK